MERTKEKKLQQRHTTPEQQPEGGDHDLLTPDLPKEMKPIQSIVWVFLAVGVIGLICAFVFVAFR